MTRKHRPSEYALEADSENPEKALLAYRHRAHIAEWIVRLADLAVEGEIEARSSLEQPVFTPPDSMGRLWADKELAAARRQRVDAEIEAIEQAFEKWTEYDSVSSSYKSLMAPTIENIRMRVFRVEAEAATVIPATSWNAEVMSDLTKIHDLRKEAYKPPTIR